MSVSGQLNLWRTQFLKAMDEETYEKKRYDYYIRHIYGLVGSRKDKQPYACERIQQTQPQIGCSSGCPFKEWDSEYLSQEMMATYDFTKYGKLNIASKLLKTIFCKFIKP